MAPSDPTNPLKPESKLSIKKLHEGFSYMKESTSLNPAGLHRGVWKTLIRDEDAFEPYALMIMFAFKFGEPPHVWTNSQQVILGKDDPGKPIKIYCIHWIQLVCAAMNISCHIIWGQEMLKHAAQYNLISPYQFGSQNGHISISCILLKCTSYNIIWLMCLVAIIFDNDATTAYDWMIPSQCMITSAHTGVPSQICHQNETNSSATHKILCQDCLWQVFSLLHEYFPPLNFRPSARKLWCWTHLDPEFICATRSSWPPPPLHDSHCHALQSTQNTILKALLMTPLCGTCPKMNQSML